MDLINIYIYKYFILNKNKYHKKNIKNIFIINKINSKLKKYL